jgi:hypothetical protein
MIDLKTIVVKSIYKMIQLISNLSDELNTRPKRATSVSKKVRRLA